MKKIITIFLALALVLCLAIPAHAVTPELDVPDMPEIPDISDKIDFGIDFGAIVRRWLEEHPIPSMKPIEIIHPTEHPDTNEQQEEEVVKNG